MIARTIGIVSAVSMTPTTQTGIFDNTPTHTHCPPPNYVKLLRQACAFLRVFHTIKIRGEGLNKVYREKVNDSTIHRPVKSECSSCRVYNVVLSISLLHSRVEFRA